MDMKKYTYTFFWMDDEREIYVVKAQVEMKSILSRQNIYDNAEQIFEKACKQNGISQKQMEEADYMLAVQEGWCDE